MVMIGLAGEIAGETARGPGSLQVGLLDALYELDTPVIMARARLGPAWRDAPGGAANA